MNYRPITLLSSVDNIVEKNICEQIHVFIEKKNIITEYQFGFQSGKSTSDLLAKFTDEVNMYLNERKYVLALFINCTRAFDTIGHNRLIDRLDEYGMLSQTGVTMLA